MLRSRPSLRHPTSPIRRTRPRFSAVYASPSAIHYVPRYFWWNATWNATRSLLHCMIASDLSYHLCTHHDLVAGLGVGDLGFGIWDYLGLNIHARNQARFCTEAPPRTARNRRIPFAVDRATAAKQWLCDRCCGLPTRS